MIGKKRKRVKKVMKQSKNQNKKLSKLNKEKEQNNTKSNINNKIINNIYIISPGIINNEEKEEEKNNMNSIFYPYNNNTKSNINTDMNIKNKLNYSQVKNKIKKININISENNVAILNNIDRLTSVLSSIIIAQNENENDKNNQNNDSDERIFKNEEDSDNIGNISPLVIDANNDEKINYLLSLNDSLKKKINNDIKFDQIYDYFTNFAFQKIENILNNLKKNK